MSELPQCVYMTNDRFFALFQIRGDNVRAPLRDTVEAAKEDLLGLRKKHGGGGARKLLPRFVFRYCTAKDASGKGYYAARWIGDVRCKAPLRTSVFAAYLDAKKMVAAQTSSELANITFTKFDFDCSRMKERKEDEQWKKEKLAELEKKVEEDFLVRLRQTIQAEGVYMSEMDFQELVDQATDLSLIHI